MRTAAPLVVAAPLAIEAIALRRGAPTLRIVQCGVGPARARAAAGLLLGDPAGAVAIAGVCGALERGLAPGTVFVADALLAPDGRCLRTLAATPLCDALAARGIPATRGALIGSERLCLGASREPLRASGARVTDMESPWLAAGAGERPLAVLRVVCDGPEHELLRPGIVIDGLTALRRLRDAAPALADWAAALAQRPTEAAVRAAQE